MKNKVIRVALVCDRLAGRVVIFTRQRGNGLRARVYRPGGESVSRLLRAVDNLDSPWGYTLTPRADGWELAL